MDLCRRAHQVLGRFANEAPLFVAAITRVINDGLERPLEDALERELDELADLFASEDARRA